MQGCIRVHSRMLKKLADVSMSAHLWCQLSMISWILGRPVVTAMFIFTLSATWCLVVGAGSSYGKTAVYISSASNIHVSELYSIIDKRRVWYSHNFVFRRNLLWDQARRMACTLMRLHTSSWHLPDDDANNSVMLTQTLSPTLTLLTLVTLTTLHHTVLAPSYYRISIPKCALSVQEQISVQFYVSKTY